MDLLRFGLNHLVWSTSRQDGLFDFRPIAPGCFGVGWHTPPNCSVSYPTHICYEGKTYVPLKASLSTKVHNRLARIINHLLVVA